MTVCCQCGRHYWPGKNHCPGRPSYWNGTNHTEAKGCGHLPCENCQHYVDEKEKDYGKRNPKRK